MLREVSVVICTYQRPKLLRALLAQLDNQVLPEQLRLETLVIDNDPEGSAHAATKSFSQVRYVKESVPGISAARNRGWREARFDTILYLDDDQSVCRDFWLEAWHQIARLPKNWAGVKLPVQATFAKPQPWFRCWMFGFHQPELIAPLTRGGMATNGLFLRRTLFDHLAPFDESLGLTGGEDTDLFMRYQHLSWWHLAAPVIREIVPEDRCHLGYLKSVWNRKGQTDALLDRRYKNPAYNLLRFVQAAVYYVLFFLMNLLLKSQRAAFLKARQAGKIYAYYHGHARAHYQRKDPVRVMFVTQHMNFGGAEKMLEQIGCCHSPSDMQPHYLFYNFTEDNSLAASLRERDIPIKLYRKEPGIDFGVVKTMRRVAKEHRIQIIHTHDNGGLFYGIVFKLLMPKVKVVHTVHTLHNWRDNPRYRFLHQLGSWVLDKIICVAPHVQTEIAQLRGSNPRTLVTVPNGIDTQRFRISGQPTKPYDFDFISISRVSPEKNLATLFSGYADLRQQIPGFRAIHVGDGPAEQVAALRQLLDSEELANNLLLAGYQSDVSPFLARSAVFVSASLEECHPVSVLEALAMGKICVCSDIPAHRLLPKDSVVLFDPKDPQSLAKALANVLSALPHYQERAKSAQQVVHSDYSISAMLANYVRLYRADRA